MKRKDLIFTISLILLLIKTVWNLIAQTESIEPLSLFMLVLTMILLCENCSKHMFNGDFYNWLNEKI